MAGVECRSLKSCRTVKPKAILKWRQFKPLFKILLNVFAALSRGEFFLSHGCNETVECWKRFQQGHFHVVADYN